MIFCAAQHQQGDVYTRTGFHFTQEFPTYILGVRRAGTTQAATSLQNQQTDDYSRGDITILDSCGLEARYEAATAIYALMMQIVARRLE